jgi:putative MATE family efflux protein
MNNNEKRAKMLGEEKIETILIKLAIPAIIGMLVNAIYNIVDTVFVGKLGTSAIGAATVAFPLFMLIGTFGLTFGVGAASYISRLLGENNKVQADKATSTAFFTSMTVGILYMIIGSIYLEPILRLFGATDTILPYAKAYSRILVLGSVFTMINMTMNNMLRAEGSAKISMIALSVGAGLNILLDPLFIFGFDMGIQGAAIATVLSQMVSRVLLLSYFLSGKSYIKLHIKYVTLSTQIYSEIMKIGIPTFLRQCLISVAMALINVAAMPYGDGAVAGIGVANRVFMFGMYVLFGYCQGFQPVAGYNYGANKYDRLTEAIKVSLKWTTIFSMSVSVIFLIFAQPIVTLFSNDPEVIRIASESLRAMSLLFAFGGFMNVYSSLFQALGYAVSAAILSLARQGLFLIPAVLISSRVFGLEGLIYSQTIADFFTIIVTAVLALRITKQIRQMREAFSF